MGDGLRSSPSTHIRISGGRARDAVISSGVRQVLWSSVGVVSSGGGRLLANILVGRAGGAAVLGSMATVLAVGQILVSLWPGSLGSAGVKFIAQARGRGDVGAAEEVRAHLASRAMVSCALLGAVGGIGWSVSSGSASEGVAVALVVAALGSFGLVQGLLYAERRTRASSLRESAAAVGSLVLVALLLTIPGVPGPWLAVAAMSGLLLYAVGGWPRLRPRSLRRGGREIDAFTATSAFGSLSSQGFIQLSVVAAATLGSASAGQFAVALALCTPLTLLVTPLGLALFPAVNEAVGRGDTAAVRRQITLATHFLAYVLVLGGGLIVVVRAQLVTSVWGPEFARAADVFVPVVMASALAAVAIPATNGMTSASQRYASRATAYSILSSCVGVASWFVLVPTLAVEGVAVGLVLGRAAYTVAVLVAVRRLHGLDPWVGLTTRCLVLGAVLVGCVAWTGPLVVGVAVFAAAGLVTVASDPLMRRLLKEQVSWPTKR